MSIAPSCASSGRACSLLWAYVPSPCRRKSHSCSFLWRCSQCGGREHSDCYPQGVAGAPQLCDLGVGGAVLRGQLSWRPAPPVDLSSLLPRADSVPFLPPMKRNLKVTSPASGHLAADH